MPVIAHNIAAMFTDRQLKINTGKKAKKSEKLSSGYRINRAADDAAGLAISEKMRKKIRSLDQGAENMQDGVSLVQVADGALNETQELLQRMNELTIQAANGTNSESDLQNINKEINQIKVEIDRIANTTSFNKEVFPLRDGKKEILDRTEELLREQSSDFDIGISGPSYIDEIETIPGGDISIDDIVLPDFTDPDLRFDARPFNQNTPLDTLSLFAMVTGTGTAADNHYYSVLYTGGSGISSNEVLNNQASHTSFPCVLYNYNGATGTQPKVASFRNMTMKQNGYSNPSVGVWERTFSYKDPDNANVNFDVKQTVTMDSSSKKYTVDTEVIDTGSKNLEACCIVMNFDTSYKGGSAGDRNEGYYLSETGPQVRQQSLFTDPIGAGDYSIMNQIYGYPDPSASNGTMVDTYEKLMRGDISNDGDIPGRFIVGGKDEGNSSQWMPFVLDVAPIPMNSSGSTTYSGVTSLTATGMPTDTSITDYSVRADNNYITINGIHNFAYNNIYSSDGQTTLDSLSAGTYSFTDSLYGLTFTFEVGESSTLDDIKQSLSAANVNVSGAYDNSGVTGVNPVEKSTALPGDNSTQGDFLIMGKYDGTNKTGFISSYGGNGTGSDIYGIDHTFSYGTFGSKNSMSFSIMGTGNMIDPDTGQPIIPGDVEVHKQIPVSPASPSLPPKHTVDERFFEPGLSGKQVKIQASDEVSDFIFQAYGTKPPSFRR
ncbi:MAG: hypothetical protein IJ679_10055 [Lachnospiraceae bacterium]|nr:hypothetical protein [Lachnospiraceae bacterium]